jgi:hypothetical protein
MRGPVPPLLLAALAGLLHAAAADAQYFGRNKVQYRTFDFHVIRTANFDVYYYPETRDAAVDAARMVERAYARLSRMLGHEFRDRKPLIVYASHTDFQQTNALPFMLDEGTGGVTESYKSRMILPFTGSYAEFDHVLTHELVHAFQYDVIFRGGAMSDAVPMAHRLPLWFMEGMAEYLSIGRIDPHTASWLRDAVLQGYLRSIGEMSRRDDYLSYRFGQSLWAFVAGRWGDEVVGILLQRAPRVGRRAGVHVHAERDAGRAQPGMARGGALGVPAAGHGVRPARRVRHGAEPAAGAGRPVVPGAGHLAGRQPGGLPVPARRLRLRPVAGRRPGRPCAAEAGAGGAERGLRVAALHEFRRRILARRTVPRLLVEGRRRGRAEHLRPAPRPRDEAAALRAERHPVTELVAGRHADRLHGPGRRAERPVHHRPGRPAAALDPRPPRRAAAGMVARRRDSRVHHRPRRLGPGPPGPWQHARRPAGRDHPRRHGAARPGRGEEHERRLVARRPLPHLGQRSHRHQRPLPL